MALRVREARESKGWTQDDLARAAGVRPMTISRIERGAIKESPGLDVMRGIARACGVSLDWLVDGLGEPPPQRDMEPPSPRTKNEGSDPQPGSE